MSPRDSRELELQIQYRLLEDLRNSERHYLEILDRLNEIVFECDEEHRFSFLNAAWTKALGYPAEDCIGQPIEHFVDPLDRTSLRRLLALDIPGANSAESAQFRFRDQNDEVIWLELCLALGEGLVRQGSLRDLTETRRADNFGKLKRFFSPQLAELILDGDANDPLETHRRDITVVFLDLRGFTTFAETSEPEELMGVLHEFHADMGRFILQHEGTLERFTGDGMMIFFNDPVEVPNPTERAIRMALAMQQRIAVLSKAWRKQGWDLTAGIGIAQGYATIGAIGYEGRWDYAAIGTVTNLAARLCDHAREIEILASAKVAGIAEAFSEIEEVGPLNLKGFTRPVPVFRVNRLTDDPEPGT
jgi:PAS domain S-box-containing protein